MTYFSYIFFLSLYPQMWITTGIAWITEDFGPTSLDQLL